MGWYLIIKNKNIVHKVFFKTKREAENEEFEILTNGDNHTISNTKVVKTKRRK